MFHPEGPSLFELALQAMSSTTRGYDLIAPKFEHTPFRTPDDLLEVMMAHIGPVDAGLDVCCGTGAAMGALKPLCAERVTGIDLSEGMLAEARRRLEAIPGDAEVSLLQHDALEMPFEQAFDVATCCGAFGHVLPEDQDRFVAGIWRALKPGGRFVFITRTPPTPRERVWWVYRGFNATMKVRNALWDPPFIMYYLIFTLPRALEVLTRNRFSVEVLSPFAAPYDKMRLIVATRPA